MSESIQESPSKKARPSLEGKDAVVEERTEKEDASKGLAATSSEEAASSSTPPYGSQDYWEQRYRNLSKDPEAADNDNDNDDNDGADPYHAWYFTYNDLRPLILPLILGAEDDGGEDGDSDDDDQSQGDPENFSKEDSAESTKDAGVTADDVAEKGDDGEQADNENFQSDDASEDGAEEYDEVEFDEEEEEEEREVERHGLAKNGPINVLEVGCGDVPLGADLALELDKLESETDCSSNAIVNRIVCIDYSKVVVEAMNKEYLSAIVTDAPQDTGGSQVASAAAATELKSLQFAVEDARKMTFADKSFELILEKGTLDAMLSDKKMGVANCIEIVTECARVLSVGGYLVIISHLNAHTPNGVSWLQEVVHTGLKKGDNASDWHIEVHGNAEAPLEGDEVAPSGSPGPAVYIIHKKSRTEATLAVNAKSSDEITIPVSFFGY